MGQHRHPQAVPAQALHMVLAQLLRMPLVLHMPLVLALHMLLDQHSQMPAKMPIKIR